MNRIVLNKTRIAYPDHQAPEKSLKFVRTVPSEQLLTKGSFRSPCSDGMVRINFKCFFRLVTNDTKTYVLGPLVVVRFFRAFSECPLSF